MNLLEIPNKKSTIITAGRKLKLNKIRRLVKFIKDFIYYRGLAWGNWLSIKEMLVGKFPNIEVLARETVRLSYAPPVFNDGLNKQSELLKGIEYVQYTVRIKNAIIYGDSNLITLPSGKILYDLPFYDQSRRYQYTNYNSKIIKVTKNKVFYWKGRSQTQKKAVWMGGNFSWNYYHLLYEFVIKFRQLEALNISLDVPVLVDQASLKAPQYKELWNIVNEKGYRLVEVSRHHRYKVDELIYINCPNFIPPNNVKSNDIRWDDIQFDVDLLLNLRNHFLPYSSRRKFSPRIFISRKNASGRRHFNEEEVIALFSEFGFEVVYPEKLSVEDQISLFNQAEWIAGGSGAAFTNLLFCSPNAKVIIFTKLRYPFTGFSTIASAVAADLLYITEEDAHPNVRLNNIHEAFELDIPYLRKLLTDFKL
jgi:hypothetical protein